MENKISVTILDDHQSIVDGYVFRLSKFPQIEIINTLEYGEELEGALKKHAPDVLILDVNVKVSEENSNNYPIFHVIPDLLQRYPDLAIRLISMHKDRSIIRGVVEGGARRYILKDAQRTISEWGSVILSIVGGGIYLSRKVRELYIKNRRAASEEPLTGRQMEA